MVGPPSRGVLAGIKADAQKAKETGGTYDPNSVGTAWSHNFLNQKPWHPSNFRNQARVFDAEQRAVQEAKSRAEAKAQLEAEHEQLKTISYLSAAEQAKYAERQSISFMYMKPPGYDAALSKVAAEASKPEQSSAEQAGPSGPRREQRRGPLGPPGGGGERSSVGNMLGAMAALQQNDKWELSAGMRQELPAASTSGAENQTFVMDNDPGDLGAGPPQPGGGSAKQERRERKRQKVEEAKAILRQHGLEVPGDSDSDSSCAEAKRHRKDKDKKKKKHKHKKHRAKD